MLLSVEDQGQDGKDGESQGSRHGHYKRQRAEAASDDRKARSASAPECPLVVEARPSRERDGGECKHERQRHRRNGFEEPDLAHEPRRGDRAHEYAQREQRQQEGPDCLGVRHYCLV